MACKTRCQCCKAESFHQAHSLHLGWFSYPVCLICFYNTWALCRFVYISLKGILSDGCLDASLLIVVLMLQFIVFSVPLFCHMSATAQRLVLSFIYVHREHIPLSVLKDFIDVLFTATSILPASGWIRLLLDLLMIFCCARIKVCLDEQYDRRKFDMEMRHEVQTDDLSVQYDNAAVSKQAVDYSSLDFSSLKDIVQHHHNGSSLRGPSSCFDGLQTELEKESDITDMKDEMSVEFFDTAIIAATQLAKTDDESDDVSVLSQKQTGIVMFYYVVFLYIFYVILDALPLDLCGGLLHYTLSFLFLFSFYFSL